MKYSSKNAGKNSREKIEKYQLAKRALNNR
jgi:hypothetical protein